MIIFAKIRISVDYRVFILRNVHPAAFFAPPATLERTEHEKVSQASEILRTCDTTSPHLRHFAFWPATANGYICKKPGQNCF